MKKLFFLLIALLPLTNLFAQQSTPSSSTDGTIYCMMIAEKPILSSKQTVEIDFGQKWSVFSESRYVTDENNKIVKFNSSIDALNHLARQGWEVVNSYAINLNPPELATRITHYYILKKELTDEELHELQRQHSKKK